jgi:hypothetical protein
MTGRTIIMRMGVLQERLFGDEVGVHLAESVKHLGFVVCGFIHDLLSTTMLRHLSEVDSSVED